jgi:hypothetical protein
VKASASVRRCEQEGAPAHVMNEFEQLLQVHISLPLPLWMTLMFCPSSTSPHTWITILLAFRKRCKSLVGLSKLSAHD